MRRIITLLIFILIFISGAGFAAINMTPSTLDYYIGTITLPLSIIIAIAIIIGIALGTFALFLNTLGLRYENRRLNKKLSVSVQEVNSLRILPLKDAH